MIWDFPLTFVKLVLQILTMGLRLWQQDPMALDVIITAEVLTALAAYLSLRGRAGGIGDPHELAIYTLSGQDSLNQTSKLVAA